MALSQWAFAAAGGPVASSGLETTPALVPRLRAVARHSTTTLEVPFAESASSTAPGRLQTSSALASVPAQPRPHAAEAFLSASADARNLHAWQGWEAGALAGAAVLQQLASRHCQRRRRQHRWGGRVCSDVLPNGVPAIPVPLRQVRQQVQRMAVTEDDPADPPIETWEQTQFWASIFGTRDPWDPREGDNVDVDPRNVLEKKRVMMLISDTGGGHRASAKALADALEEIYPGQLAITIRDVWTENCPWPFNAVVQSYMWMAQRPWTWRIFWHLCKWQPVRFVCQNVANARCKKAFRHAIERDSPDLIISVHPCTQHLTMKVLKRLARNSRPRRRIPLVTVVTDLSSAHPLWFHPEADRVFVPSDACKNLAMRCGVRESAIHTYGLPLRRQFWSQEKRSREEMRRLLGLHEDRQTVLIVGGGDGVGRLQQVATSLADSLASLERETQVVVICGRNDYLKQKLKTMPWPEGVHVEVRGFVSNMDEWMAASNVIVTKAGPGTIAESCTRGLPIMLSSYLPGQERGNVTFVEEGGFGHYSTEPQVIGETVTSWLRDPEELQRLSKLSTQHSTPTSTLKIAQVIGAKWLETDTSMLASALMNKLQETETDAAEALAEDGVTPTTSNTGAVSRELANLQKAQDELLQAQLVFRSAKAALRTRLEQLTAAS